MYTISAIILTCPDPNNVRAPHHTVTFNYRTGKVRTYSLFGIEDTNMASRYQAACYGAAKVHATIQRRMLCGVQLSRAHPMNITHGARGVCVSASVCE